MTKCACCSISCMLLNAVICRENGCCSTEWQHYTHSHSQQQLYSNIERLIVPHTESYHYCFPQLLAYCGGRERYKDRMLCIVCACACTRVWRERLVPSAKSQIFTMARVEARVRNPIWVFHMIGRNPVTRIVTTASHGLC